MGGGGKEGFAIGTEKQLPCNSVCKHNLFTGSDVSSICCEERIKLQGKLRCFSCSFGNTVVLENRTNGLIRRKRNLDILKGKKCFKF